MSVVSAGRNETAGAARAKRVAAAARASVLGADVRVARVGVSTSVIELSFLMDRSLGPYHSRSRKDGCRASGESRVLVRIFDRPVTVRAGQLDGGLDAGERDERGLVERPDGLGAVRDEQRQHPVGAG